MENRRPDEVSSWEYLCEHLYQKALKGGYQEEFATCKTHLPILAPFQNLKDFIQSVEANKSLREQVISDIKKLWLSHYDLRPALGTVLLLTMWQDLPTSSLENFYYNLFVRLSD